MAFGIYVHIPYCLQKCHYCDFSTIAADHELRPQVYTDLVLREIHSRYKSVGPRQLSSLYFGGGTPSLLPLNDLARIIGDIDRLGFSVSDQTEVTIEINPGTITHDSLKQYLGLGVNRFSVGVQTFDDALLKKCGREHSAETSMETLTLLAEREINYSADLLFGLPGQNIRDLEQDVSTLMRFNPKHVSPYNLTLPQKHVMNKGRAPDEEQAEMFEKFDAWLGGFNLQRYEISNFAKSGFESRHNILYWSDAPYWGIGVSAHSYLPSAGEWGVRFWNSPNLSVYMKDLEQSYNEPFYENYPVSRRERLSRSEALTDFCHTHLRRAEGLNLELVAKKFDLEVSQECQRRLEKLLSQKIVETSCAGQFKISKSGRALANQVFLALTF